MGGRARRERETEVVDGSGAARPEGGFTLVELLITLVIMATAFAAILSGLAATFAAQDVHKKVSEAEWIARNYAEAVKRFEYVECAAEDYDDVFDAVMDPFEGRWTATLPSEGVEFWDGQADPAGFVDRSECLAEGDNGVQRITLTISSVSGVRDVSETIAVVKRDE